MRNCLTFIKIIKMKKLLTLLIGLTILSCSGADDDNIASGRTTDPYIGFWRLDDPNNELTWEVNANGNLTAIQIEPNYEDDDVTEDVIVSSGTWSNNGNDFDALIQIYTITVNDAVQEALEITYNEDFSEFSVEDRFGISTFVRQ